MQNRLRGSTPRSIGWAITDAPANSRLTPSASFAQASHRIGLTSEAEVDADMCGLIAIAYTQNG
ncbi:MAG: hypothetical protein EPN48_16090 [Microbacteriaceae bacterium]|nr:MAG: hypothetical protein EPN48_16090 [Microbacteriaceae bacterium]